MTGHDSDLDFVRGNHPRTVRSDEYRMLSQHPSTRRNHVANGHPFSYADDEIEARVNGLVDCCSSEWWGDVDYGDGCARLLACFLHCAEYRNAFELFARLVGIDAGYKARLSVGVIPAQAGV